MALFNRKPKNSSVLPEVDQYYSAERRERAGLAWVLALVSIVVVALVLIGLFFGGRWVFRKINNDDKATVNTSDNTGSFDGEFNDEDGTDSNSATDTPDEAATPQPATPSTTPAPVTTPTTPATPAPASNAALPNTGPASTAMVFVASSLMAGGAHYIVTRRKAARN